MNNRSQLARMEWAWSLGGLTLRQLAYRVWRALWHEDALGRTAELSYYFLLSLFPFLICVFSIVGLVFSSERELYYHSLSYLQAVMPAAAFEIVRGTIDDVTRGAGGGRLSFALVFALWTASMGMDAVIKGLNLAYKVREFRSWWHRRLLALALTAALLLLMISALTLFLAGEHIGSWLVRVMPSTWFQPLWDLARWLIVVTFMLLALNTTYLFGPNLKEQRWRAIMPGSLVGFACWVLASLGFRLYLMYFDSYSKTYGSLGAVVVLLLWLYLTGAAILIGGEVNAQIRHAAAEAGSVEAQRIAEAR